MKNSIALLIMGVFCAHVHAQIGIGTIDPDASAALEISSTTQGVLTPRLTTAQRLAISEPANGLLVYDTDADLFYFYNGTEWSALESATATSGVRDNYKLVQSAADLSDELSAGGGSEYLLNENYLYEINGPVTVDYPIDLNGAYIAGLDATEDMVINNASGALFQTSNGGSLRNIFINGNGNAIFDLSGGGTSNLVVNNTVFAGASSLGNITDMNVVFFSIVQLVNNSEGVDFSDISSLLLSNVFWNTTNSGTFLDLSGTLGDFQFSSGRVEADAGEVGVDVSSNPTISISASMDGINFNGEGARVKGYTSGAYAGYNFTNDWNVNCSGIPLEADDTATGDINLSAIVGSGYVTSFSGTGSASRTKLVGTSTSNNLFRFVADGNNRIVYKGTRKRYFNVTAAVSFQSSANNTVYVFYLARGSSSGGSPTILEETKVYRQSGGTGDIGALAITGTVELESDEYIEVWVERYEGSGSVLTVSLNLVAY